MSATIVHELTCTFCGASIDRHSRCPGCGGPISIATFDADDSGAMAHEPLTPSHWEDCGRCGGSGQETRLEGDREYSLGPCMACDGRCEIEVESIPAGDTDEIVDIQADAARAELEAAARVLNAGPLPADKASHNAALFARIEGLRADIRVRLDVIEMLAGEGVRKQFIHACENDHEVRMDAAFLALRVYNQRHAAAMLELQQAPTDADAAATNLPALCRDVYEALRGNGFVPYDDLVARFGVSLPRVVAAVKQLELAGERSGARIIRYQSGAEIDELVQQPETTARRVPIRAANSIAGIPVRRVPGQRAIFGVYRPKLRTGSASLGAVAKRLVELGMQPAAARAV